MKKKVISLLCAFAVVFCCASEVSFGEGYSQNFFGGYYAIKNDDSLWNITKVPPEKILEDVDTVYYDVGVHNSFAVCKDGSLWSWGENRHGVLGTGTSEPQEKPVKILENVDMFYSFENLITSFAIKKDGTLWAWGKSSPVLGFENDTDQLVPVKILDNVKSLASAEELVYAVLNDGSLLAWGRNFTFVMPASTYDNLLGTDAERYQYTPVKVMDNVESVQTAGFYTVAITKTHELWGWGYNYYRNMPTDEKVIKTPVKLKENIKEAYINEFFCIVKDINDSLWIYGDEGTKPVSLYGRKRGTTGNAEIKIEDNVKDFVKILFYDGSEQWNVWYILKTDGTLLSYRYDEKGFDKKEEMDNVRAIYGADGPRVVMALKEDGSLWSKGKNPIVPVLGTGGIDVEEFTKILDDVEEVGLDYPVAYAVKKDGSLWFWGGLRRYSTDESTRSVPTKVFDGVRMANAVRVFVNGARVDTDSPAYIKDGRTFVPMRAIFEAMGASVTWDNDERCAIGEKDGVTVKIKIGEAAIYKNGEKTEIDSPAEIVDGRTMVPVRAIAEAFGAKVEWDNDTRCVIITE